MYDRATYPGSPNMPSGHAHTWRRYQWTETYKWQGNTELRNSNTTEVLSRNQHWRTRNSLRIDKPTSIPAKLREWICNGETTCLWSPKDKGSRSGRWDPWHWARRSFWQLKGMLHNKDSGQPLLQGTIFHCIHTRGCQHPGRQDYPPRERDLTWKTSRPSCSSNSWFPDNDICLVL